MLYKFDTDSLEHAKAALLLYAMYRSRGSNSPLNGVETWDRFQSFIRAACLKSNTTAEFVQEFCRKARIDSVKPRYLSTEEPVVIPDTGELIISDSITDYRLNILADDGLLPLYNTESIYIIMLVRERLQRDKMRLSEVDEHEETDEI